MFLIALSNIALAVLLALGPLFISALLFDATRRFFSAWIAQLANYGLITVLTIMVAALLLQLVQSYATQTAARGASIFTLDALNLLLVAVLVFLILRQVMPIAAGLAGGLALSSFGVVGGTLGAVARGATGSGLLAAKKTAPPLSRVAKWGYGRVRSWGTKTNATRSIAPGSDLDSNP
jgi:type IV secretion system protein VirB6